MLFYRIWAIVVRQYYLTRANISRILLLFMPVAVDIVLWGFISKYLNTFISSGFNFTLAFLGAMLLWEFLVCVMRGVSSAFFDDVWSRNFLNLFTTPLRISEYVFGLILSGILTSSVGLGVMLVLASTVFGLNFFTLGLMCIPFMLILFLFGIALGISGCTLVLRLGPGAEWFVWVAPTLIVPFAGVFYPLSTLPQWMQYVAYTLPPSYVFGSLRSIILGNGIFPGVALGVGGCLAVIYVFVAYWLFAQTYKMAVRSGLIARYSAEG